MAFDICQEVPIKALQGAKEIPLPTTHPQDTRSKSRDLFSIALFTIQESSNYHLRREKILVRSCMAKITVPDMEPQSASINLKNHREETELLKSAQETHTDMLLPTFSRMRHKINPH